MNIYLTQIQDHVRSVTARENPPDPAHDYLHFCRVASLAHSLCKKEGGDPWIVLPAAWLHDLVNVPKNHPGRSQASKISAQAALKFLTTLEYPSEHFRAISHAIEAHSFSAKIEARSLEARIVQDADRLDGLGAIGIARVFTVGARLGRPLYHEKDPFALSGRELDDLDQTLDHFWTKLLGTYETLQTSAGKREGYRRVTLMKSYLEALRSELS
jgi:uncharacterized protein